MQFRRPWRRLWQAISHLSVVVWLWSIGGGAVTALISYVIGAALDLDLPALILLGIAAAFIGTAITATVLRALWGDPGAQSRVGSVNPLVIDKFDALQWRLDHGALAPTTETAGGIVERASILASLPLPDGLPVFMSVPIAPGINRVATRPALGAEFLEPYRGVVRRDVLPEYLPMGRGEATFVLKIVDFDDAGLTVESRAEAEFQQQLNVIVARTDHP